MKEFLESCRKLIITIFEVMYLIKDFISILLMSIVGCSLCSTKDGRTMIVGLTLAMFWLCLALRQIHREYLVMIKKSTVHKRYTHVDNWGNPYIRKEDLPEIVEYLYRLEEAENAEHQNKSKS